MSNEKNAYAHSEEYRLKFGNRLRSLRQKKGLSIDQVITSLNIPRSTYSGWELGKRIPLTKSLANLAKFYDTNVDFLLLKSEDPTPENVKDLNDLLEVKTILWKGKPITEEQANKIAAIIDAYLEK